MTPIEIYESFKTILIIYATIGFGLAIYFVNHPMKSKEQEDKN